MILSLAPRLLGYCGSTAQLYVHRRGRPPSAPSIDHFKTVSQSLLAELLLLLLRCLLGNWMHMHLGFDHHPGYNFLTPLESSDSRCKRKKREKQTRLGCNNANSDRSHVWQPLVAKKYPQLLDGSHIPRKLALCTSLCSTTPSNSWGRQLHQRPTAISCHSLRMTRFCDDIQACLRNLIRRQPGTPIEIAAATNPRSPITNGAFSYCSPPRFD